jgi:hypothetical protein
MDSYEVLSFLNPFFSTKEQLAKIELLRKTKPLTDMLVKPFMEYHRVPHMQDLTFCLADDLIAVMEGRKKLPQKTKKEKERV